MIGLNAVGIYLAIQDGERFPY